MSKYILKKKYPGSPEVGTEIIRTRIMGLTKPRVLETYMIKGQNTFSIKNPQDYPELWEKVMDLDYEILSFKSTNNSIHTKRENGRFLESHIPGEGFYLESGYLLSNYCIYSVKRLSDNTIWTIGDKIDGASCKNITITSIDLNANYLSQIQFNHKDEGINLNNAKKSKTPIYKTEDSVDIFQGDKVHWVVTRDYRYLYYIPFISKHLESCFSKDGVYKVFSTKEAADEWILMNKPCLSIRDCMQVMSMFTMEDELKEIIKNKLK